MKYWYVVFEYQNDTLEEYFTYEQVIQSEKEHFPLKEAMEMASETVRKDPNVSSETDYDNDEWSIMIVNQIQINEDDFINFNEEQADNEK